MHLAPVEITTKLEFSKFFYFYNLPNGGIIPIGPDNFKLNHPIMRFYVDQQNNQLINIETGEYLHHFYDLSPLDTPLSGDNNIETNDFEKDSIIFEIKNKIQHTENILKNIFDWKIDQKLKFKGKHWSTTNDQVFLEGKKYEKCSATNMNFRIFRSHDDFEKAKKYVDNTGFSIESIIKKYKNKPKNKEYSTLQSILNGNTNIYSTKAAGSSLIREILGVYMLSVFVTELQCYIENLKQWIECFDGSNEKIELFKNKKPYIFDMLSETSDGYDIIYKMRSDYIDGFARVGNDFYISKKIILCHDEKDQWHIFYEPNVKIPAGLKAIKLLNEWTKFIYELDIQSRKIWKSYTRKNHSNK